MGGFSPMVANMLAADPRNVPELAVTEWDKTLLRAAVARSPRDYFRCSACNAGPWHRAWISPSRPPFRNADARALGPCCTGAA